jgi:hypothetical protein
MQPLRQEGLIMKPLEFLRRHLLLILFGLLIAGQVLMWRTLVSIRDNTSIGNCGDTGHPCHVIIIQKAY